MDQNLNNCPREFSWEMENCLNSESQKALTYAMRGMGVCNYFMGDMSPITMALGKMFEGEINLSIVQYIRKLLKIPMPDYYGKLFPQENDAFIIGRANFNNKTKFNEWMPPECGTSEHAFYKNPRIWDEMLADYPYILKGSKSLSHGMLCYNWKTISDCRNKAAHPHENGYTLENLDTMKTAIKTLDSQGCFRLLCGLREHLQVKF